MAVTPPFAAAAGIDTTSLQTPPPTSSAQPELSHEVVVAMEHLEPLWESMKSDIASCQATFRIHFLITPEAPLTPTAIHDMLARYDLEHHLEQAPQFLQEVAGKIQLQAPPVRHHFILGNQIRHDINLLSHVHVEGLSLISDGANQQIHVYERGRTTTEPPDLSLFRISLHSRAEGYLPQRAERDGNLVRLVTIVPPTEQLGQQTTTNTIDWSTGIPIHREFVLGADLVQEVIYSGLSTFAGGITFPRSALTIRYAKGSVIQVDMAILDDAKFNEPIQDSTFHVTKPQEWHVLDFRNQANGTLIPTPDDPVGDVRTVLTSSGPAATNLSVSRSSLTDSTMPSPMRILLILNGIVLISVGIWMWKRASLAEPKH